MTPLPARTFTFLREWWALCLIAAKSGDLSDADAANMALLDLVSVIHVGDRRVAGRAR